MAAKASGAKTLIPYDKAELATFLATITPESFNEKVACYICGAKCGTAHGLRNHLHKHGATSEDLAALLPLRNAEDRAKRQVGQSSQSIAHELELTLLKPAADGDVTHVACKCGKPRIPKNGLKYHLQKSKQHKDTPVADELLTAFRAFKDGRQQDKKGVDKLLCNTFEIAFRNKEGIHKADVAAPSSSTDIVPVARALLQLLVDTLLEIRSHATAEPKGPSNLAHQRPDGPLHHNRFKATINNDTYSWVDTKDTDTKKQSERGSYRVFPWSIDKSTDISAFQTSFYGKKKKKGTRAKVIGGLQQWLSLFNLHGMSLKHFLEQLACGEDLLMPKVLDLPIADPNLPWTHKMMTALSWVCRFYRSQATARDDNLFANKMSLLLDEYIEPRLEACCEAANERLAMADETDYAWLACMASASKTKVAVQEMMVDLAASAYGQAARLDGKWSYYGTVCMAGILFMGQCNSRPGPWEHLTTDTLQDMKDAKRDYWTAIKGVKMLSVRGATGRYMSPGCVRAADEYCKMKGRDGNRFWLYKFPKLSDKLNDACRVYLPGHSVMSPTAMRQFWETKMYHDKGELAEKVAKAKESMANAMDHGAIARDKNYIKGKARKVAADSKACTIAYFDGEIEWPCDDMSDEFLESRAKSLVDKFAFPGIEKDRVAKISKSGGDCDDMVGGNLECEHDDEDAVDEADEAFEEEGGEEEWGEEEEEEEEEDCDEDMIDITDQNHDTNNIAEIEALAVAVESATDIAGLAAVHAQMKEVAAKHEAHVGSAIAQYPCNSTPDTSQAGIAIHNAATENMGMTAGSSNAGDMCGNSCNDTLMGHVDMGTGI
jgi:hypothetical protein